MNIHKRTPNLNQILAAALLAVLSACTPAKPRIDIDYERLIQSLPPEQRAEMINKERDRQAALDIEKMRAISQCRSGWFGGGLSTRACQRRIEKLQTY
jgi:hypothetical protein